jgi:transposase-like protein
MLQIPPANLAERPSPDLAPGLEESTQVITPEAVGAFVAAREANRGQADEACYTSHDQPDPARKRPATNMLVMPVEVLFKDTPWNLSPKQARTIELLLSGKSDREIARKLSISRMTVWRWRHTHNHFRTILAHARKLALAEAAARLRELAPLAVEILQGQLTRHNYQAASRLLKLIRIDEVASD